jgi:hypothetical protein
MSSQPQRFSRRAFLRASLQVVGGGALVTSGSAAYAFVAEKEWVAVERVTLDLPRLPAAFDGYRLAQISDLHFGSAVRPEYLLEACQQVSALTPDAIVITGDFVSRLNNGEADWVTRAVHALSAPDGVYATLGNHDWWEHAETVSAAVEQGGGTLLRNRHVRLERLGGSLYLAGVDDIWEGQHDLAAALTGIPSGAGVVLLAHEPDFADEVAADGRVDLQLSGHSHGGQVRLPIIGAPLTPRLGKKYKHGWYRVGPLQVYTNRGLGLARPAVRINCRPEITLFTLRAGQA